MSVFVDDMRARYGRMIMCHMLADSVGDLHAMADRIGVARRWFQGDHYDICLAKRARALQADRANVDRFDAAALRRPETQKEPPRPARADHGGF